MQTGDRHRPKSGQEPVPVLREDRKKGFFVAFDYSSDALTEIGAFFRNETQTGNRHRPKSGLEPVPALLLTAREILEEHIVKKLA